MPSTPENTEEQVHPESEAFNEGSSTTEDPLYCTDCDKHFKNLAGRRGHDRQVHGIVTQSTKPPPQKVQPKQNGADIEKVLGQVSTLSKPGIVPADSLDTMINSLMRVELLRMVRPAGTEPQKPGHNGQESRELEALRNEIKELKSEMSKKESEQKYEILSSKIDLIAERSDQQITQLKDMSVELLQKSKDQELSFMKERYEANKPQGLASQLTELKDLKNIVKDMGGTLGMDDTSPLGKLVSTATDSLGKASEALFSEDNLKLDPPAHSKFAPVPENRMNDLRQRAQAKAEKEQGEATKMEAEVERLKMEQAQLKEQATPLPKGQLISQEEVSSRLQLKPDPKPPKEQKADPQPPAHNFDSMSFADLKKIASSKGLQVSGKGFTRERILSDLKNTAVPA